MKMKKEKREKRKKKQRKVHKKKMLWTENKKTLPEREAPSLDCWRAMATYYNRLELETISPQ